MKVARCHARSNWENSQPPALLAKTDWNETTNVFASWNSNSTNRLSGYDLENQYAGQKLNQLNYSVLGSQNACKAVSFNFTWGNSFTKSVNSNFRVFWLAPVILNILGHWLFVTGAKMASRFETFSERRNLR